MQTEKLLLVPAANLFLGFRIMFLIVTVEVPPPEMMLLPIYCC